MKKTFLFLIVTFSVLYSADAQWYERSCGVTDLDSITTQEFECLWAKATITARMGKIITGIGTSFIVVGGIIVGGEYAFTGVTLGMIGIVIDVFIGAPVWITGASRKSRLRKNPLYDAPNSGSFNLSPTISKNHFNNSYSVGFTASLKF